MKKTKALGEIYKILYQQTDIQEVLLQELSIKILSKLEEIGMAPPEAIFERYQPRQYQTKAFYYESVERKWEK